MAENFLFFFIFYNALSYRLPSFVMAGPHLGCKILSCQLPFSFVMINVNRMEISPSAE